MASKSTKSADAKKRKQNASAEVTPEAPEPQVEPTDSDETTEVEETQEPAPEAAPRRTADEWLQVCAPYLGVKPRILRATVSGHAPGRKYTEDEIRRLIQRKLGEPA